MREQAGTSPRRVLRDGLAAAWPIIVGYLPLGLALGVLARQAGLTPLDIGLMSLLVFAGSAQFIAVSLIAGGTGPLAIVVTTFVVNIRHLLMSSALAIPLRGLGRPFLAWFAYGITDESFAVNMERFRQGRWDRWRALVLQHAANATWIAASVTGALAGNLIPPGAFGIDFALPAMFLALLVLQLGSRLHLVTALVAAAVAVLWHRWIPGDAYAVAAAVTAATVGYLLQRRAQARGEEA